MPTSDLELLDAFTRARRRLSQLATQELKELAIGTQQAAIVFHLSKVKSASLGELARAVVADPAAITRAIASLARQGVIERTGHPSDRRRSQVSLRPEGRKLAREIEAARARIARGFHDPLSPADKQVFLKLLSQLDQKEPSA
jgi:DNA-binding MarR family transcriptional regulator